MAKLKLVSLKNKIHVKHGFPFKGELFSSEGKYIVLTPGNFEESGGFKLELDKAKYYGGEIPLDYVCKKGDLVVAMTEQAEGLLGSTALVPEDDRFLHNQRIGLITITDSELDKLFVYHLFNTKSVRQQIRRSSSGSKVKHTSPDRIYDVLVELPSLSTQQKIARVLSSLNAKIKLNHKINASLDLLAKTIFDYWFVQFDFPDKNGKPYKSSCGIMVWNEKLKREIPEGWCVESLDFSEITKLIDTGINNFDGKKIYLSTSEVENDLIVNHDIFEKYENRTSRANMQPKSNSVWFARMKDTKKIILVPDFATEILDKYIFSTGFAGLQVKENGLYYVWNFVNSENFENVKNLNSTGSTQKGIINESITNISLIIPKDELLDKFNLLVKNAYIQKYLIERENIHLIKLRDFLLPMLMNGQVQVS